MSASWPSAVPTTAGLYGNLVDNCATALNGALTAGAVTITVDDTTGFPSSGILSIRSAAGTGTPEVCAYTGKTGTTFTGVTRNYNSRLNQAWADNDVVELLWTAEHFNRAMEEVIAIAQNLKDRFGFGINLVIPAGVTMTLAATAQLIFTRPDGSGTSRLFVDNDNSPSVQPLT